LFEPETQEVFDLMQGISNGEPFYTFFVLRSSLFFPKEDIFRWTCRRFFIAATKFLDIQEALWFLRIEGLCTWFRKSIAAAAVPSPVPLKSRSGAGNRFRLRK
jgi:hypothetical protein